MRFQPNEVALVPYCDANIVLPIGLLRLHREQDG